MKWISLFSVVFSLIPVVATAHTFMMGEDGTHIRWSEGVRFEFLGNPSNRNGISAQEFQRNVNRSLQVWEEASYGQIQLGYRQGTDPQRFISNSQYNGVSSLYFASNESGGSSGVDAGIVGLTQVWFRPDTGEMLETDIVLNDVHFTFGQNVDLQDVLTHEIGHALGLSHSGSIHATMFPVTASDQKNLSCDDQVGLQSLYGTPYKDRTGGLYGRVRGPNGQGVLGVQMQLVSQRRGNVMASALTDHEGRYFFDHLEPGDYFVLAEPFQAGANSLNPYYWGMNPNVCSGRPFVRTYFFENGSDAVLKKFKVERGKQRQIPVLDLSCETQKNLLSHARPAWVPSSQSGGEGFAFEFRSQNDVIELDLSGVQGDLELRVSSFSLYSSAQVRMDVFDSSGRSVKGDFHQPLFYDQGGIANQDSAWIGKSLPLGDYTIRLSLKGHSRSYDFPSAMSSPSDEAFFVLSVSLNQKKPELESILPWNAKCYAPTDESNDRSPALFPDREYFDSDSRVGFCGRIQWDSSAPPPPPPGAGALAGWAIPWAMMFLAGAMMRRRVAYSLVHG